MAFRRFDLLVGQSEERFQISRANKGQCQRRGLEGVVCILRSVFGFSIHAVGPECRIFLVSKKARLFDVTAPFHQCGRRKGGQKHRRHDDDQEPPGAEYQHL